MDLLKVTEKVVAGLESAGVRYALIGGLAMALHGLQRATTDADFILMAEDMAKADAVLTGLSYRRMFHSENVSHYQAPDAASGRIDILHAFRKPAMAMLGRAVEITIAGDFRIKVAQPEDLIGLKIQALVNSPARALGDWNDIAMLLQTAGEEKKALDWQLLEDYLRLFELENKLPEMKKIYAGN